MAVFWSAGCGRDRSRSAAVVACGVLCVAVLASCSVAMPGDNEHWSQVRTRHFILVGRNEKDLVRSGIRLERFRARLQQERGDDLESGVSPTTIIVFKDEPSFALYKLTADGKTANYAGVFAEGHDRNYIGMNAEAGNANSDIVFHEYVHYFLAHQYGEVPLWLNEGLAEYYSTFRADKNEVHVGLPVDNHVLYLREKSLLSLGELFEMNTDSKDYREGERQGVFYAESWALVHYFLIGDPARAVQLQAFLNANGGLTSQAGAFVKAFGVDYAAMEQQLADYVQRKEFLYLTFESVAADEKATVLPLTRADLLYTLGDYVAHVTRWRADEAEAHFREALRLDPNHARAHAALAALLAKRDLWPEAEVHFQKAIEADPADALPFYSFGAAQLARGTAHMRGIPSRPGPLSETIQAARGLLSRSVELAPDFAEACFALGCTYLYDPGDVTDGVMHFEHARHLVPARMDIAHDEMMLCLNSGHRTEGEQLANEVLFRSQDANVIRDAKQALQQDDVRQLQDAVAKLNAHDYKGGTELLERLRARTESVEILGQIDTLLQQAASARQDDAKEAVLMRQIDEYNRASEKTNRGDYPGALAILRKLAPQVKDPELNRKVKELMKNLRAALENSSPSGR